MAWAVVTGASRGIGKAIALQLASDGFDVGVIYRSQTEAAQSVVSEIEARGRKAFARAIDVSSGADAEEAMHELIEAYGAPEVLVNNAGITRDGLFAMMGRSSWEDVLSTNLHSFYSISKPVVRQMLRQRSGRIVNLTSISGQRGNAGQVNYAASKAGIIGATKALALELAPRGITVNAVAPGFIETDMVAEIPVDKVTPLIPMKRVGSAEEVAKVVSFLCSSGASYVTGQVIGVSGGLYT